MGLSDARRFRKLWWRSNHYGSFITAVIQFVTIAAAVFFFIIKPVQMTLAHRTQRDAEQEAPSDAERRHQELLAALGSISQ